MESKDKATQENDKGFWLCMYQEDIFNLDDGGDGLNLGELINNKPNYTELIVGCLISQYNEKDEEFLQYAGDGNKIIFCYKYYDEKNAPVYEYQAVGEIKANDSEKGMIQFKFKICKAVENNKKEINTDVWYEINSKAESEGAKFGFLNGYNGIGIGIHKLEEKQYDIFLEFLFGKDADFSHNCIVIGKDADFPHNRIVFGAPGTGKSFRLEKERETFVGDRFERVTFHPDYSYANFVGTYKPVPDKNDSNLITYEFVPGPFMRTYVEAKKHSENMYLLIIEEINRANAAAVFGDMFQLLDRNSQGESQYSIQASEDIKRYFAHKDVFGDKYEKYIELKLPANMYIWATMNSADQGVFPLDTAFKRRWDFEYIGIDDSEEILSGKSVELNGTSIEWNSLRKAINKALTNNGINEDKQLGPFFLSTDIVCPDDGNIDSEKFTKAFKDKVLMYLFEDAAKHKRSSLFSGDIKRYSEICKEFDKKGIEIFTKEVSDDTKSI